MSDLTPEQQQAYLRARKLTRPDGIERTLEQLDLVAEDFVTSSARPLRQVCRDAATIIRHLGQRLDLEDKLRDD